MLASLEKVKTGFSIIQSHKIIHDVRSSIKFYLLFLTKMKPKGLWIEKYRAEVNVQPDPIETTKLKSGDIVKLKLKPKDFWIVRHALFDSDCDATQKPLKIDVMLMNQPLREEGEICSDDENEKMKHSSVDRNTDWVVLPDDYDYVEVNSNENFCLNGELFRMKFALSLIFIAKEESLFYKVSDLSKNL